MKINEVAKLTGITARTLHYYDEIDLLKPREITSSGYRLYGIEEVEILQQIMFFKELDFKLSDIKEIMTNPHYDKTKALIKHRELLIQKRDRLDKIINLVEDRIEGEKNMSFKEFSLVEIEENKKKYAKEVKERWGTTDAYTENEKKVNTYDLQQWKTIDSEVCEILKEFGENRYLSPESIEAQELVKRWKNYITNNFYFCSNEILSCLGIMYEEDERFKNNIDKNGVGTAKFMKEAIKAYCINNI